MAWPHYFRVLHPYKGDSCCLICQWKDGCENRCPKSEGRDCSYCSWLVDTPCDPANMPKTLCFTVEKKRIEPTGVFLELVKDLRDNAPLRLNFVVTMKLEDEIVRPWEKFFWRKGKTVDIEVVGHKYKAEVVKVEETFTLGGGGYLFVTLEGVQVFEGAIYI